jgi:non-ribosomal peptide synthetase component E (peptide arylation enzyme)
VHRRQPEVLVEGRWHRPGELLERAQRIASRLANLGVREGGRVIVTMANCREIVPRADAQLADDELIDQARDQIGGYKYPLELHLVEARLTAVGKVDRKPLRRRLAEFGPVSEDHVSEQDQQIGDPV